MKAIDIVKPVHIAGKMKHTATEVIMIFKVNGIEYPAHKYNRQLMDAYWHTGDKAYLVGLTTGEPKTHSLSTLADLMELTPDQLENWFMDFRMFHIKARQILDDARVVDAMRVLKGMGPFNWVDDNFRIGTIELKHQAKVK